MFRIIHSAVVWATNCCCCCFCCKRFKHLLNSFNRYRLFVYLFRLSIFSWQNYGNLCHLRKLSISFKLLNLSTYVVHNFLLLSSVSGENLEWFPLFYSWHWWFVFSFLFFLVSLTRGLSILLIFQRIIVLVSHCCYTKLPQTLWLKTAHIYCLTVLEVRSPKSISLHWS